MLLCTILAAFFGAPERLSEQIDVTERSKEGHHNIAMAPEALGIARADEVKEVTEPPENSRMTVAKLVEVDVAPGVIRRLQNARGLRDLLPRVFEPTLLHQYQRIRVGRRS